MTDGFITTTTSEGLRPLGSAAQRSYDLITGVLEDRLDADHAALFAEQISTPHGDRLDWYAARPGQARQLADLDPEVQDSVRAALGTKVTAIRTLAETIDAEGGAENSRLAEALRNALEIPGEEAIWVQDGEPPRPVLVSWACLRDEQRAVRGVLSGLDRAAVAAAAAAAAGGGQSAAAAEAEAARLVEAQAIAAKARPATASSVPWGFLYLFGWLILVLMVGAILYLLTAACGLRGWAGANFCPPPEPQISATVAETLVLQDEIQRLETRIADADRACQPPPPPPPPPPPAPPPQQRSELVPEPIPPIPPTPAPPARTALDDRLQQQGARVGALTFSLAWDSVADLHLEVTCPRGGKIWYGAREVCGGTLDVGGNHSLATARRDPIENIFFNAPMPGTYSVSVSLYGRQGAPASQPFRLQIRHNGQVDTKSGTLTGNGSVWNYTYLVTP